MKLRAASWGLLLTALFAVPLGDVARAQSSAAEKSAASPKPEAHVVGSYGNWTLLCGKETNSAAAKERCSLVLPLIEKESDKLIFRVIFTYGPQGRLVLRVDGPTGLALQRGVEFSPDSKKIYRMPFQTCLPMGCKALLLVEDDMRQELVKSKKGSIRVYALNGRAIEAPTALEGFSAGMAAMDKQLAETP